MRFGESVVLVAIVPHVEHIEGMQRVVARVATVPLSTQVAAERESQWVNSHILHGSVVGLVVLEPAMVVERNVERLRWIPVHVLVTNPLEYATVVPQLDLCASL